MTQPRHHSPSASLSVIFAKGLPVQRQSEITYAARNFAAAFGVRWDDASPAVRLCYGVPATRPTDVELAIGGPLRPQRTTLTSGAEYWQLRAGPHPDWLADIFEWLAAPIEHQANGDAGRVAVPFESTLVGRYLLDPEVPWAAIAMEELNRAIVDVAPGWPRTPIGTSRPIIAATHDLDFLPLGKGATALRIAKNAAIALLLHRSLRLAASILASRGRVPSVASLVQRERESGVESSSWYVIAGGHHRRDANYSLSDPRVMKQIRLIADSGGEVGIHGSYESVLGTASLPDEYAQVRALGLHPIGGRQHWLRFRPQELIDGLAVAGAAYDSSVGFSERVGFRAGVPFAYVPWSMRDSRPAGLIQLPMIAMDATLFAQDGHDAGAATSRMSRVINGTRGWARRCEYRLAQHRIRWRAAPTRDRRSLLGTPQRSIATLDVS